MAAGGHGGARDLLFERDSELAALEDAIARAARGEGSVGWIEGPPGVGKTSLADRAADAAATQGLVVLRAVGAEAERLHPFGVVRQLFEHRLRELDAVASAHALAGVACRVPALLDPAGLIAQPVEAAAAHHALYWLTAQLADLAPLLLVVDDVQWADAEGAAFLAYLSRRIRDLPVALVVTSRPLDAAAPPAAHDIPHLADRSLRPQELTVAGVEQLIGLLLTAERAPAAEFVAACHRATGGNPFYLQELATVLNERGVLPEATAAAEVAQTSSPHLVRRIAARLRALGGEAVALAEAVAVLGDGTPLRDAAALAELPHRSAATAADALAAGGLFAPGLPLRFRHPIVRGAIYGHARGAQAAEAHARAARVLLRHGAPADVVAPHLLVAEPLADRRAGQALVDAGRHALSVGAPATALRFFERAAQEPAPSEVAAPRERDAGTAAVRAGDWDAAVAHLTRAMALAPTPDAKVEAAVALARAHLGAGRMEEALRVLAAVDALADNDRARLRVAAARAYAALSAGRTELVADEITRLGPGLTGETPEACQLLTAAAHLRLLGGEAASATVPMLRTVVEGVGATALAVIVDAGTILLAAEETDLALAFADRAIAHARGSGSQTRYAVGAALRAHVLLARGDVTAAEADAEAAYEVVRDAGWTAGLPFVAGALAHALVERGRPGEALAVAIEVPSEAGPLSTALVVGRARAHLALHRYEEAAALLPPQEILVSSRGWWLSTRVAALHAVGRAEEAVDTARDALADPRSSLRARAAVLRALARIQGPEDGLSSARASVDSAANIQSPLERAYSHSVLGELLRRGGVLVEARDHLRRALDLAAGCGASALQDRARAELVSAGARPRRDATVGYEALTGTERRVAQLAADGLSNPDIAQALFVSRKTVEKHLGNVYAKLGIGNRNDLVDHLG